MTIERIVDVPVNRRIFLDLPPELPIGKVKISIFPLAEKPKADIAFLSMRGSCKGLDTMDAYFARKRADMAHEDRKEKKS